MELRQLEYFVAVAEEANFTRAAERVHISQSGVSAQIRRLEQEVGAALIDRSARRAALTAAGEAALPHARAALAAVGALRSAVDDVNGLIRGHLTVGMVIGCRVVPLFDALAAFHQQHPGVEIALAEDNSDRLVDLVRTGGLDLALVATAGTPPPDLDGFPIVREGLVAGVAPGHPLAGRRRARLADVTAHPIVSLPPGTGIRTALDQACAARGLRAEVTLEANAPDSVADLAARGLGVAVLSVSTIAGQDGRLHTIPIEDGEVPAVLAVVWSSTPSPALAQLVRHTRQAFSSS
jgi:DNA-binding transcriptional LysR family regulator